MLIITKNYFNGFHEISNFWQNDNRTNAFAALKILSYFTVFIPLAIAGIHTASSLFCRVSTPRTLSNTDGSVNDLARKTLFQHSPPTLSGAPSTTVYRPAQVYGREPIDLSHAQLANPSLQTDDLFTVSKTFGGAGDVVDEIMSQAKEEGRTAPRCGVLIAANSGLPCGQIGRDGHGSERTLNCKTQEESIMANVLLTQFGDQYEQHQAFMKQSFERVWGMIDGPTGGSTQTIQGIDFTKADRPEAYAQVYVLGDCKISPIKESSANSKQLDQKASYDVTLFFADSVNANQSIGTPTGTMRRTLNARSIHDYDFFVECIKTKLRSSLDAMIAEGITHPILAKLSCGIYAGNHKDRINAEFEGILAQVLQEPIPSGPETRNARRDYFQEVILSDVCRSPRDSSRTRKGSELSIGKIPDTERTEYRVENIFPERPIDGSYGSEGFQHFQIGDIPFSHALGCFEGPQIARYNTEGHQFPALLCRIKLDTGMCQKLPYLPKNYKRLNIQDGYLTIWGNLPHEQAGKGGGEHLMFRPQILFGQIPNAYGMLNKGGYPLEIGVFTDNHNFIRLDEEKENADHPSSLPFNKLGSRSYDCHGNDDDPASGTYDDTYLTSVMGTFDIQGTSDFTVFAKLKRDTENYRSFPEGAYENMVSYNICLTDELTQTLAPIFHNAPNLRTLIQDLAEESDPELKKTIANLVRIFS